MDFQQDKMEFHIFEKNEWKRLLQETKLFIVGSFGWTVKYLFKCYYGTGVNKLFGFLKFFKRGNNFN